MSKHDTKSFLIDDDGEVGELTDEWFAGATLHENGIVKRLPGQRGLGKKAAKRSVTLRLDPAVLDSFKSGGTRWQTRVNEALRASAGLEGVGDVGIITDTTVSTLFLPFDDRGHPHV